MPLYTYRCPACALVFDESAPLAEYDRPRPCEKCGQLAPRDIAASMPSVIFKGDGWTTKNLRIKGQMQRKNERLDKKMMEMRGDGKYEGVVPNVAGERTDSWSDAQKLAKDRGLDAGSYDSIVDKERKGLTS